MTPTLPRATKVVRKITRVTNADGSITETTETTCEGMTPEQAQAEFNKIGIDFEEAEKMFDETGVQMDDAMKGVRDVMDSIGVRLSNVFKRKKPPK